MEVRVVATFEAGMYNSWVKAQGTIWECWQSSMTGLVASYTGCSLCKNTFPYTLSYVHFPISMLAGLQ